jgi:hypothetical protein
VEKARTHIDVDVCVAKHSILYGIEIGWYPSDAMRQSSC